MRNTSPHPIPSSPIGGSNPNLPQATIHIRLPPQTQRVHQKPLSHFRVAQLIAQVEISLDKKCLCSLPFFFTRSTSRSPTLKILMNLSGRRAWKITLSARGDVLVFIWREDKEYGESIHGTRDVRVAKCFLILFLNTVTKKIRCSNREYYRKLFKLFGVI